MDSVNLNKKTPGEKFKAVISNRIYLTNTPELEARIREDLTYVIPPKFNMGRAKYLRTWIRVSDKVIAIPRERQDLIPFNYKIIDKRADIPLGILRLNYELFDSQLEAADKLTGSGILNAKPGWGKTFTAVELIRRLGKRALIVVHTNMLARQWLDHIEKHTNISPGFISGEVKENLNAPIVVGIVNSVEKIVDDISSDFGTVIIDECHHCPATTFTSVLSRMKAIYNIGLSATLKRVDGHHVVLPDYFGPNVVIPSDDNRMEPEVYVVNSPIPLPGTAADAWPARINELMANEDYISFVQEIVRIKTAQGHRVLTIADRKEFLERLAKEDDNGLFIHGGVKHKDREALLEALRSNKYNNLYGSSKIFSEGISENYLSCIVLAHPIANEMSVEQVVSRVLRKYENKLQPSIIDIKFPCNTGKRQFNTRMRYYAAENWKVHHQPK